MKKQINEIRRMQQLAGILKESQLNEVISSELEEYISELFNMSVPEDAPVGKLYSGIWEKNEYASDAYVNPEMYLSLIDFLKSSGGRYTLEGNPDIDLELLPNENIKFSAVITND